MVVSIPESGATTTCTAREHTLGKMDAGMKVTTTMIASMARAFTLGRMVVNTRATGSTESNMVTVSTVKQTVQNVKDVGKKANAATGMTSWLTQIKQPRLNDMVLRSDEL